MVAPLRTVIVKRPEEAFRSLLNDATSTEWQDLAWTRPPNLDVAIREHVRLVSLLHAAGARTLNLPEDSRTGLDSLYAHDPVLITDLESSGRFSVRAPAAWSSETRRTC